MINIPKSFTSGELRSTKKPITPVSDSLPKIETTTVNDGNRQARMYAYAKAVSSLAVRMGGGCR